MGSDERGGERDATRRDATGRDGTDEEGYARTTRRRRAELQHVFATMPPDDDRDHAVNSSLVSCRSYRLGWLSFARSRVRRGGSRRESFSETTRATRRASCVRILSAMGFVSGRQPHRGTVFFRMFRWRRPPMCLPGYPRPARSSEVPDGAARQSSATPTPRADLAGDDATPTPTRASSPTSRFIFISGRTCRWGGAHRGGGGVSDGGAVRGERKGAPRRARLRGGGKIRRAQVPSHWGTREAQESRVCAYLEGRTAPLAMVGRRIAPTPRRGPFARGERAGLSEMVNFRGAVVSLAPSLVDQLPVRDPRKRRRKKPRGGYRGSSPCQQRVITSTRRCEPAWGTRGPRAARRGWDRGGSVQRDRSHRPSAPPTFALARRETRISAPPRRLRVKRTPHSGVSRPDLTRGRWCAGNDGGG